MNELYQEPQNLFDIYVERFGISVTTLIYIGHFDDKERDFHVIAWKGPEENEE